MGRGEVKHTQSCKIEGSFAVSSGTRVAHTGWHRLAPAAPLRKPRVATTPCSRSGTLTGTRSGAVCGSRGCAMALCLMRPVRDEVGCWGACRVESKMV